MDSESVQTVSQLTDSIKDTLNSDFADVWVSGEVTGLSSPQSGHIYFTLKDQSAQLSAILWRSTVAKLQFVPEDGMQVLCRGRIDVYPQRGNYQLIARSMQPLGQGALQLAFRKLHERLKAEGLFDESHKMPLPAIPRRVVVITSPTGAAVHDFLQVATRRWPHLDILVVPVLVQGPQAAEQIAAAIKMCGKRSFKFDPDVIVVTRGGGSIEDLWAFNEEVVVRAIFKCSVPLISAIGHEIDVSLSDLVADLRALTPSEAGEKLVPEIGELTDYLSSCSSRLTKLIERSLAETKERLVSLANRPCLTQPLNFLNRLSVQLDTVDSKLAQISTRRFEITRQRLRHYLEILQLSSRNVIPNSRTRLEQLASSSPLGSPLHMLEVRRNELQERQTELGRSMRTTIDGFRQDLRLIESKLVAFNPENVLKRGYSLTVDQAGHPLVDCKEVNPGDRIQTWLGTGKLTSRVETIEKESNNLKHG